jgi:small subunit ribosomal protein S21
MIRIQVRPNEPLESALRRFKRQCNYAGIFRLAKKYNFFEKKSDRERRERRERIRTMQRAQRRAMGPTKVRRSAKKSKFRKGGSDEANEADIATAAALEQKGKELRLSGTADAPAVEGSVTPAPATASAAPITTTEAAPQPTTSAEE